ncbi:ATP-NAD kinase-like domain-containing protein [Achaetomium macrosporum]|uniref:ATP-NAD kinase-like domain-containing protein n=1 Tax=Achaetomium macrosporum TaxID=79813 RepID=A0AAN7C437_9PEZI|nr:ATP-NAD kinase-like domain-containing protein [Achaetomium macrosporum]
MGSDTSPGPAKPGRQRTPESSTAAAHDAGDQVLTLLSGVTLTLGQDALLLSGQLASKPSRTCPCIGIPGTNGTPSRIPYYNILWAEITGGRRWLVIDYADQTQPHFLEVRSAKFAIAELAVEQSPDDVGDQVSPWVERLLDCAYSGSVRRKRAWVLVNPHAGPGGADKIWEKDVRPIFEAARMPMTVVRTSYSGEAVGLARDLSIDDYDIAIPCSGDGLPHEVFNGLAKRPDARRALSKIAVCHIPCGSGNAMSCNLYGTHRPTLAALAIVKGVPTPIDLVSVTHGDQRTISFLSQALGMVAELDLGTEHLRWMGAARFTVGFLTWALQRKTYPCDIAVKAEIDDKEDVKRHYRQKVAQVGAEASENGDKPRSRIDTEPGVSSPTSNPTNSDDGLGLPPLKYGTVNDKLPDGWELTAHDKLGSFYCGNMAYMAPDLNFFSAALANDGLMDLITTDGDISLLKAIGLQLGVESGKFFDSPLVSYRKVSAFRIIPRNQETGYISIDGEAIPFGPIQAEVHQGLGLTLSKKGVFEAPGPRNWDTVTNSERLLA